MNRRSLTGLLSVTLAAVLLCFSRVAEAQAIALIAFASDRNGNYDIWTMWGDGSHLTQITNHPADDTEPDWSPDGRKIAFASRRSGNADIWVIDVQTRQLWQITNHPADDQGPTWSPDGNRIAFVSYRGITGEIWVVDVANLESPGVATKVTTYDPGDQHLEGELAPDWCTNGFITYQTERGHKYVWSIWATNPDTGQEYEVVARVGGAGAYDPAWSADGLELAYSNLQQGTPSSHNGDIYVSPKDGAPPNTGVPVTDDSVVGPTGVEDNGPAWSPSGERIYFYRWTYEGIPSDIYAVNRDGTGLTNLTNHPATDCCPSVTSLTPAIPIVTSGHVTFNDYVVDGQGKLWLFYSHPGETPSGYGLGSFYYTVVNPDGTIYIPETLLWTGGDGYNIIKATVDSYGKIWVVHHGHWGADLRYAAFLPNGNVFKPDSRVPGQVFRGETIGFPSIAGDTDGHLWIVYSTTANWGDRVIHVLVLSACGGSVYRASQEVSGHYSQHEDIAVDSHGHAWISWEKNWGIWDSYLTALNHDGSIFIPAFLFSPNRHPDARCLWADWVNHRVWVAAGQWTDDGGHVPDVPLGIYDAATGNLVNASALPYSVDAARFTLDHRNRVWAAYSQMEDLYGSRQVFPMYRIYDSDGNLLQDKAPMTGEGYWAIGVANLNRNIWGLYTKDGNAWMSLLYEAPCTLTLQKGGTGSGKVRVNGALHLLMYMQDVPCGSEITLEAVPGECSIFAGWSGDLSGSANPVVVTMDGSKTITVNFAPDTVPPTPPGIVINSGTACTSSTSVTLGVGCPYDAIEIRFRNDPGTWSPWEPCSTGLRTWALSPGGGRKVVCAQARDSCGNVSPEARDGIWLAIFEDVPCGDAARRYVEALFAARIANGCSTNPPRYCPGSATTRAQMAVFLCRAAGKGPLDRATPSFCDVPKTNPYYGWIERLTDAASWGGNPPAIGCAWLPCRQYCPSKSVTRDEMATFLVRATGKQPMASCAGIFADVDRGGWACPYIERLVDAASWPAGVAVTNGCAANPLRYCPKSVVTRGHMAVLLVRAFGIPL